MKPWIVWVEVGASIFRLDRVVLGNTGGVAFTVRVDGVPVLPPLFASLANEAAVLPEAMAAFDAVLKAELERSGRRRYRVQLSSPVLQLIAPLRSKLLH